MTPPDAVPHEAAAGTPTATGDANTDMTRLFFRVFPSIVLPMFLASIDQTIVATALPNIAGSLGEVERISWVVVAYLMATTISAAVYGRLGDVFGRKKLLFIALGIFVLASVLCGIAPTMLSLIAARVLQGAGGGGLMTLSQALVGEVVPPRQRARYQGYLASTFMVSATMGPVAGGWLTQHWGWQSVFLVNLPLGALAILLACRLPTRVPSASRFRFDWAGLALFTGFVVPLLLALERAQRPSLAAAAPIAGLLAVAAVALVLLLRQERRSASPLIPVNLLRHPAIWRADGMGACIGAMLVAGVTFMPIYLQVVRGVSPENVGLLLLPLTAGVAVGSLATGQLIGRTGRTAIFPSVGQGVVAACWLLLGLAAASIPLAWLPAVFLVISLFLGTGMPVVQITTQTAAGPKNLGAASASVQFSRSIGAALGTAAVAAVLFATLAIRDPQMLDLFTNVVERGPAILQGVPDATRQALGADMANGFSAAFLLIGCFGLGCMLLAWALPLRRL